MTSADSAVSSDMPALEHAAVPEIPGWHAFRSRPDAPGRLSRFWATRVGRSRRRPAWAGPEWAMTVDADTPAGLRREIERQQAAGPG